MLVFPGIELLIQHPCWAVHSWLYLQLSIALFWPQKTTAHMFQTWRHRQILYIHSILNGGFWFYSIVMGIQSRNPSHVAYNIYLLVNGRPQMYSYTNIPCTVGSYMSMGWGCSFVGLLFSVYEVWAPILEKWKFLFRWSWTFLVVGHFWSHLYLHVETPFLKYLSIILNMASWNGCTLGTIGYII